MNLANRITLARLLLSGVYFALLAFASAPQAPAAGPAGAATPALLDAAFIIFLVALGTDFLDGYLARRQGTITSFGRVADPFVDKILVCGSLVFLSAARETAALLPAWVTVAVLAREFIVHGVRAQVEARGRDFGASLWGKLKMVAQSLAVGGLLLYWGRFRDWPGLETLDRILVWSALALTLFSGVLYVWAAREVLRLELMALPPQKK